MLRHIFTHLKLAIFGSQWELISCNRTRTRIRYKTLGPGFSFERLAIWANGQWYAAEMSVLPEDLQAWLRQKALEALLR